MQLQRLEAGTDLVLAALESVKSSGDQYWLAELHRLQGELLRADGADGGCVRAHFQQAIETARQQGARMLELRAAVSLARLWQGQGRSQAAQQELAEVYDWFTEGFDTGDLKAANDLLQELV